MTDAAGQLSLQVLFDILVGGLSALGGGIVATMWKEIKDARKEHAELLQKLPETYARRDDVAEAIRRIEAALDAGIPRIFDKLDGKADKPHR